jgi:hypothetical protein
MVRLLLFAALAVPAGASDERAGAATRREGAPEPQAPAGARAVGVTSSGVDVLLAETDAAWPHRDEPGALERIRESLEAAERAAPESHDVLWRQARLHFWLADDPRLAKREKSRLGKIAWEYGDRAARANPDRVEGWNYAAAGMGNYALGIGVFAALRQGIEGKFKERLSAAERLDPDFESGAIQTAWGRFWYELPWPKYSARRSRKALEEALRKNPDNVRARVYLAELDLKEDEPERARSELEKAVAHPPGRYDAPEERRWQDVARSLLAAKGAP